MPWYDSIISLVSGSAGSVIDSVADVVDRFVTTSDEKAELQKELLKIKNEYDKQANNYTKDIMTLIQKREADIEDTIRTEMKSKAEIMIAELKQDDKYTKRARPTIIYVGLALLMLDFLGLRYIIFHFLDLPKEMVANSDKVFMMFLGVWGTVASVYGIGRTLEKRGSSISSFVANKKSDILKKFGF